MRVLIVEGRDILRAGLDTLLRGNPDIHVLAAASAGRRGLELLIELEPDVVLVDHVLPDMGGLEFCETVLKGPFGVGVLMVSTEAGRSTVLRSLEAGARGFVHVGMDNSELARAVKAIAHGDAALDSTVAGSVIEWIRRGAATGPGPALSARETQVMQLVSGGLSDRRIASSLGVSHNTVKTYLRRSLNKLGCRTRSEAAAKVARSGLLDLRPR